MHNAHYGEMPESRVHQRFPATNQYGRVDQRHRNTRGNRQAYSRPVKQSPSSLSTVDVDVVENNRGGTPTQGSQDAVTHDAGMSHDAGGPRLTDEGINMLTDRLGQTRTDADRRGQTRTDSDRTKQNRTG